MTQAPKNLLALDLGAESGRALLGRFDGTVLQVEEIHRFANEPVRLRDRLHWDFPRLVLEVERGIQRAAAACGGKLAGIGVDSWGVDFGLLDARGDLLSLPVHYRDERTRGAMQEVFRMVPRREIYAITGIQFLELNTIYQLAALRRTQPEQLEAAGTLLLMADLVAYFLCGRPACEWSLASTTQLLEAGRRTWSRRLLAALELPERIFPEIVPAGTVLGPLDRRIAGEAGLHPPPQVIATTHHDTAGAVAAIPVRPGPDWAYLSSGTWSLLGVELEEPELSPQALDGNFTNEVGAGGTIRFLRNINGLWLVQECRRQWAREGEDLDYAELTRLAEEAPSPAVLIDPNAPEFFSGGDMPRRIQEACRGQGRPGPETRGEIVRCALESLAATYARTLAAIGKVTGRRAERLHVAGGGSRNRFLNRLTARATGLPVIAGPAEATCMGNLLVQARALGAISSLDEAREVVARSAELEVFEP